MSRHVLTTILLLGPAGSAFARESGRDAGRGAVASSAERGVATERAPCPEDDFAPGLFVFAMLAVAVLLVLVGAGAVMALVCTGIAAFLVGFGIVTASVFAGIETKRPRTAFKVLFLQMGGLGGALSGAGIAWLTTLTGFIEAGTWTALATGGTVVRNFSGSELAHDEAG